MQQRTSTPTKSFETEIEKAKTTELTNSEKIGPTKSSTFEGRDVAKNIEIRRMSSTEDGDKVLDSAWDSPEKEEKGQTPLDMVKNIVSSMQKFDQNIVSNLQKFENHDSSEMKKQQQLKRQHKSPEPPAWTLQPSRPLQHSQTLRPNFNPPSSSVPTLLNRTGPPNVTVLSQALPPGTIMTPGHGMLHLPQQPGTSQVMQLVNTINGPVLVPEGQHLQQFQAQTKSHQEPPKLMIPTMQGPQQHLNPILMSPGHQLIAIAPQQQQITNDRSQNMQTSPQGQHQQQHVFLNQVNLISLLLSI